MAQPIMVWMSKALGRRLLLKIFNIFNCLFNVYELMSRYLLTGLVFNLIACSTSRVDTTPQSPPSAPVAEAPITEAPKAPAPILKNTASAQPAPSQPNEPPQPSETTASLIKHGSRSDQRVALTFDADMTRGMQKQIRNGEMREQYDKRIVEILRLEQVPSTFFVTGLWAESYPSLLRSLASDKLFEIENHSYDHAAFASPCYGLRVLFRDEQKINSIKLAANAIEKHAGVRTAFFRFPGGCHRAGDPALVAKAGHQAVQWDIISGDVMHRDPQKIVADVLASAKAGSIIVMHLNGAPNTPATADALIQIIPGLRKKGLRFALLRELLQTNTKTKNP